jgi:hypothetical protein
MNNFFSFGGGVQSTAIALRLIHEPDIFEEKPRLIIFADTGAETPQTYKHVALIFEQLASAGYQTATVKAHNKKGDECSILDQPSNGRMGIFTIPYFTKNQYGETGLLRRQCTREYKISPIHKRIRHELGCKFRQRIPKRSVNIWLGISVDEAHRMTASKDKWATNFYPLIEWGWDRSRCADYSFKKLGYLVPKSACFFCPFTHPSEWVRRKQEEPENFKLATDFDNRIRNQKSFGGIITQKIFIHPSCIPLDEAVADQPSLPLGINYGFGNECTGHCSS